MSNPSGRREWVLAAESELRVELGETDALVLQLLEGSAEVFGVEMALHQDYRFADENIAIFSWYGCKIVEVSGSCKIAYVSNETPMVATVNTHALLEAKRDVALANKEKGPRVMVVGPQDSGKSSLARMLAAYALRLDRTPVYVDLDASKGSLAVPGAICATCLDLTCLSFKEGFTSVAPLVYFFGHTTPRTNVELYNGLVTQMAKKIEERLQNDSDTNACGVIIDTCAWSDFSDLEIILHAAKAFDVDVILATDDRLYSSLKPSFESSQVVVVKIPRSGGVVSQDAASRRRKRKAQIDEYFYGRKESPTDPNLLSPARVTIRLSQYNFWQMGGVQLHEGIKSHGVSTTSDPTQFSALVPSRDLLMHAVVAVLHKDGSFGGPDASNTASMEGDNSKPVVNVAAGFVYFVEVDVDKDTAVILAPSAGPLPSKHIVVGSIKWFE